MSEDGKFFPKHGEMKKIVQFKDTDRRYEELQIRLKLDGFTLSKFFRALVTLYLEDDVRMMDVIDHIRILYAKKNIKQRKDTRRLIKEGKATEQRFALDDDAIDNIFDILEYEKPDL